jgi:antitoxin (DNA-binding transcriptional repressor) of toxin-antitoxin stability system
MLSAKLQEESIELTKHGKTVAVLVSPEWYSELIGIYVFHQIRAGNFTERSDGE